MPLEIRINDTILNITGDETDAVRPLKDKDLTTFESWAERYNTALNKLAELLELGGEIYQWLNQPDDWFAAARAEAATPWIVEFAGPRRPNQFEAAFLEAPWELLAHNGEYLAADRTLRYAPIRRYAERGTPDAPAQYRPVLVFMAAAPREQPTLNFEYEEEAILDAVGAGGVDLIVEESGNADQLGELMARETTDAPIDVLHLSCHGSAKPVPSLAFENEYGSQSNVDADKLIEALGTHRPRLLCLSACETARPNEFLSSMAHEMILRDVPAVLGWGGKVSDVGATRFAAEFYRRIRRHEPVEAAHSFARHKLLVPEKNEPASDDWHRARLYLGPKGGGVLSKGHRTRWRHDADFADKEFLNKVDKEIEVAGRRQFVGRRPQLQKVLRHFRDGCPVLIHGMGRQGKSSLAARIAARHPDHSIVVLFGAYDEAAILTAFERHVRDRQVREIVKRGLEDLERDRSSFVNTLEELLNGPCGELVLDDAGKPQSRPVLLIVDDFEQALDQPENGGLHTIKPEFADATSVLIDTFADARDSRLLFTSRYKFTCLPPKTGGTGGLPASGAESAAAATNTGGQAARATQSGASARKRDAADLLADVPLPPMDENEANKQVRAKTRLVSDDEKKRVKRRRVEAIIEAAGGNPRLQDILFSLMLADPDSLERALAAITDYRSKGVAGDQEEVTRFLANLALEELIGLLNDAERELLRQTTLFEIPVPVAMYELIDADNIDRLFALGLCDTYTDPTGGTDHHVMINDLVRPLVSQTPLTDDETKSLAELVVEPLFHAWGGALGTKSRSLAADYELSRLALVSENAAVLAICAGYAVRYLERRFEIPRAAEFGRDALTLITRAELEPSVELLRAAAQNCNTVGAVDEAADYLKQATEILKSKPDSDVVRKERAIVTGDVARIMTSKGQVDEALKLHQERLEVYEALGDRRSRAVTLGDVARIMTDKGQVDEALKLHHEQIEIFEALGDRRERAVTLGDVARIMTDKGQVDEALKLHHEQIEIFEALGDRRSRTVTLGDVARIMTDKGQVDEALKLHHEQIEIFEALGDRRSRAVTLGDVARIMTSKGQVDEALKLHYERLEVYEALGDRRSRAVTLGDVARIMKNKGQVDEALKLHQEMIEIFEALGDRRSRAVTLGDVARIMKNKGQVDEALKLHQEKLDIVEALGDRRSRAVTLGDVARIMTDKGQVDEALKLHQEKLEIVEALGDRRSRAVTLGDVARIMTDKGQVDEALKLHQERLEVYEALGDRRERAVTLGDVARILTSKGQVDEALKLHQEMIEIFEALRDRRERAVTLGDVANILMAKGQLAEALAMHEEELEVYRSLGDQDCEAVTRFEIAQIQMQQKDFEAALKNLMKSFAILTKIGRVDGIGMVGMTLGHLQVQTGLTAEARPVLEMAHAAFEKLGQTELAGQCAALLQQAGAGGE